MRKVFVILVALGILLIASPAYAEGFCGDDEFGTFSLGLGGGFGDEVEVGPFVLSGKYWDPMWELGVEVLYSGDEVDEYDQVVMAWLAYRYDLSVTDDCDGVSATYIGLGGCGLFQEYNGFGNSFGGIALLGWDSVSWGLEFKYAFFDPSIMTLVAYYHF